MVYTLAPQTLASRLLEHLAQANKTLYSRFFDQENTFETGSYLSLTAKQELKSNTDLIYPIKRTIIEYNTNLIYTFSSGCKLDLASAYNLLRVSHSIRRYKKYISPVPETFGDFRMDLTSNFYSKFRIFRNKIKFLAENFNYFT